MGSTISARDRAEWKLRAIDAELAHMYVCDATLSEEAAERDEWCADVRARRLAAVADLEAAGGRDPWPCVLRPLTEAQQAAVERHRRVLALGGEALRKQERDTAAST